MDLRIEHGNPTEEELAVVTAVLMARAAAARQAPEPRFAHSGGRLRSRWRRPERLVQYRSPVSWR
ncbi:acyl-CoA carboxylase subunit epsilon [Kitasatospora sp. NPDC059646]|uniref:acyl-CoA carboxylase subunit epsilon n=1 Tax=Kitasatospora sp. NPDC059646 TaxID=3346893 RepID=UPI0036B0F339